MTMVRRLLREGDARQGPTGGTTARMAGSGPSPPRTPAACWRHGSPPWSSTTSTTPGLIAYMQEDSFSHSDLYRRACRAHERKLRAAVELALRAATGQRRR